jgi:hypothetical protein
MQHVAVVYIIPMVRFHAPARHSSRLGQRFQLALGAAAALAAISLSPGSAQAYVVTVGGVQYDVTTFTGTYNDNGSKFALPANGGVMPWWGNSLTANQFASAVAAALGAPNFSGNYGPIFADSFSAGYYPDEELPPVPEVSGRTYRIPSGPVQNAVPAPDAVVTYAQATLYTAPAPAPAPGPLPLFGAAAAFGFSRKLRKRIKLAPAALGSALPQA